MREKKGEKKNESESRGTERGRDWSGIDKGSVGMRMAQKERARGGSRHPILNGSTLPKNRLRKDSEAKIRRKSAGMNQFRMEWFKTDCISYDCVH